MQQIEEGSRLVCESSLKKIAKMKEKSSNKLPLAVKIYSFGKYCKE